MRRRSRDGASRHRLRAALLAALVAATIAAIADLSGALGALEGTSISTRFGLRSTPPPTGIVIVGIDDATFGELGTSWPLARSLHGRVIDRLHAAGAREIVYDVQFTEPSKPAQDLALYQAIAAAGNVTLATSQSDAKGRTNVLGGDANLARAHAEAAAANLHTSTGGTVTRFPFQVSGLESLAVVAAERATGTQMASSRFPGGSARIDYRGSAGTFPVVSFSAVLHGRIPARVFRGKVVVVGATAPTMQDVHATPVSGAELMSGPEVQANAIWTAMHGNPLRDAPGWLTLVAIILAALLPPLVSLRLGVVRAGLIALAGGIAYTLGTQLAFDTGTVLTFAAPLFALALGTAAMIAVSYLDANGERRQLGWIVTRRTEQLRDAQLEIVARLAQAAESRDTDTGAHIERIGRLCEKLALRLGLGAREARMLRHASAMHDIGKIGIPDRVLLKPGPLDAEERKIMETHAAKGADVLAGSQSPVVRMAEQIARTHHERWDGRGYPNGLRGDEIPLAGRICAICDVFDALVSRRPYKDAWLPAQALAEIERGSGTHFEPGLVTVFVALAAELELDLPREERVRGWDEQAAA
jgi:CHASE2 domain-containing sensor protein